MAEKLAIAYPIFVDAKQTPAWHQFKVKAIPAMFLLDREGQIVAQWTGKIDYEQVEQAVLRRLEPRAEAEGP
jgi:thioredoxin-like negative regulator of GroEL